MKKILFLIILPMTAVLTASCGQPGTVEKHAKIPASVIYTSADAPKTAGNINITTEKGGNKKMPGIKIEKISMESPAFKHGDPIPVKYTRDGENLSPPLVWGSLPPGTKSVVIMCDDPDASGGTWNHWTIFNINPQLKKTPEGVLEGPNVLGGAIQGKNSSGHTKYDGPKPPPGKVHHYYFRIFALDTILDLQPGVRDQIVYSSIRGHELGEGSLMGTYKR